MSYEEEKLQLAIELRKDKRLEESNRLLVELTRANPQNAYLNYQCAWSFDCLGEEAKAVSYYEKAIQGKLAAVDLENAYVGLGSTLRALGEYEKSKDIFHEALGRFPDHQALHIFYAMTLYNVNEYQTAMEILLKCIATTSSDQTIQNYKRAIHFYSDKLDETWK
ncbi:M48 family metallopeptidase [Sporosarcina sp. Te-1]|uniref:tetratricopeptide repeat protein n=1 Tax=Sporosarcina sp. Te-1 TaxID=2818390 RepID=UPI001A9ED3F1|nr:tetratricopeptide repeat protein [Sporosarcina sp. Te-1]QTD40219.1 tetratricopeptide repeat protein [Sporosarcina sp. Te-1]